MESTVRSSDRQIKRVETVKHFVLCCRLEEELEDRITSIVNI